MLPRRVCGIIGLVFAVAGLLGGCASPEPKDPVVAWVIASAVPVEQECSEAARDGGATNPNQVFFSATVVGLGEATHGQHESFEIKRTITMHLIRYHGYRLVAYEASATKAAACEAYISGRSDDLATAMAGLGMIVWQVEENAALLRELRAWNAGHTGADCVHFVGIDVQDAEASAKRLAELFAGSAPELGARAVAVAAKTEPSVAKLWSGHADDYKRAAQEADEVLVEVTKLAVSHPADAPEMMARARELRWGVRMYWTLCGRDQAMAEMLLAALDEAGPGTKAVVWAHNTHVSRGPMRHLKSEELSMGGHVGAALGNGYYAIGFAFGEGEFLALDREGTRPWGFRAYGIDAPPPRSLEWPLAQATDKTVLVDLRKAPTDGVVAEWLKAGHGQRWFGGYNVRPDVREASRDEATLFKTVPRTDYDGILFIPRTTGARPVNTGLKLPRKAGD